MIKQRLYGLGLVLVGVASVLPTGDATAALPLVGLGTWMMCSKRSLLYAPRGNTGARRAAGECRRPAPQKQKERTGCYSSQCAHPRGFVHSEGHPQYSTFGRRSQ